ncbi:MAG: triosephosphate isomerase [Bradymonadia bacterium]|jgi:triosephosphate isomerase
MRTPIIVGNWKMNGTSAEADMLTTAAADVASDAVEVGVAPPTIWLERAVRSKGKALVFAQNCSEHPGGAHTGELSVSMLVNAGADGVILGHSERRHVYGETNARINAKVRAALSAGLMVILCVGEELVDRDAGTTWTVVERQLSTGLENVDSCASIVVAYEPVWAIGTGRTASPEQAQEVHAQIRGWLGNRFADGADVRIQYGGSVKPANAAGLLAMPDLDGALVGGASLKAETFGPIIEAARGC